MQGTFLQRLILACFAGFAAALLIMFYRNVIVASDKAMNEPMKKSKPTPVRRF